MLKMSLGFTCRLKVGGKFEDGHIEKLSGDCSESSGSSPILLKNEISSKDHWLHSPSSLHRLKRIG